MAERHLQKKCEDWATAQGWFVRRAIWNGRRGAPDSLFIRAGRHIWVEFKQGNDYTTSALQNLEHKRMREAGAEVHVVRSYVEFLKIFETCPKLTYQ